MSILGKYCRKCWFWITIFQNGNSESKLTKVLIFSQNCHTWLGPIFSNWFWTKCVENVNLWKKVVKKADFESKLAKNVEFGLKLPKCLFWVKNVKKLISRQNSQKWVFWVEIVTNYNSDWVQIIKMSIFGQYFRKYRL